MNNQTLNAISWKFVASLAIKTPGIKIKMQIKITNKEVL